MVSLFSLRPRGINPSASSATTMMVRRQDGSGLVFSDRELSPKTP